MNNLYHQYDSKTKKYLGSGRCQVDPLNKILLYPPNTTDLKPPFFDPQFKDAYFLNGVWELKDSKYAISAKLSQVNADGISIYKKVGDEVISKTPEEISKDKEDKVSLELKVKARKDLGSLKSSILERVIVLNASKEEKDLIKSYEDILKS